MTRDASGNIAAMIDASGTTVTAAYDGSGAPTSVTINGETSTLVSDAESRLTRLVDANGATSSLTYNATGDVTATTDALGNTTRRTLSRRRSARPGNATRRHDCLVGLRHPRSTREHDGCRRCPGGLRSTRWTDRAARSFSPTTLRATPPTILSSDSRSMVRDVSTASPCRRVPTPELAFDVDGRINGVTDALGAQRTMRYDEADRVIEEVDRSDVLRPTTTTTTVVSLVLCDPTAARSRLAYDDAGNVDVRAGPGGSLSSPAPTTRLEPARQHHR